MRSKIEPHGTCAACSAPDGRVAHDRMLLCVACVKRVRVPLHPVRLEYLDWTRTAAPALPTPKVPKVRVKRAQHMPRRAAWMRMLFND